jgi:cysteine synthase
VLTATIFLLGLLTASAGKEAPAPVQGSARILEGSFDKTIQRRVTMRYLLYLPRGYGRENVLWPMIMYLHGAIGRGSDFEKISWYPLPRLLREPRHDLPFMVLIPQCPLDDNWWDPEALVAELTLVPCEGGLTTKKLILDMIEVARGLSQAPHTYWTDQLNNHDSIAGYHSLGEEIWSQTKGEIDAFVHCVGTAASLRGVATDLKRHKPTIKIVAVEPAESSVLLGGQPGPHKIEGVGIGYTPPLWDATLVDQIVAVKTDDAKDMARRIAREEALFAGTSSGANVIAAIQVGERLGPHANVVTLMTDSGLKYLSTDVYRSR